jgi:(5-formylfuran-3-yl)methyl phosphate synthase
MSMMLASVTDVFEAALAIDHGADWIDVKDPRRGALGAPRPADVAAVVQFVRGRLPVSATIGDCWDDPGVVPAGVERVAQAGVDYVKVGMNLSKPVAQAAVLETCAARGHRLIVVCMAEKIPGDRSIRAIASAGIAGIMLDTADKSGRGLNDLLDLAQIKSFVEIGRELNLLTGLAGRLRLADIPSLLPAGADYLGFRSALCEQGRRERRLSADAVARVQAAMNAGTDESQPNDDSEVA